MTPEPGAEGPAPPTPIEDYDVVIDCTSVDGNLDEVTGFARRLTTTAGYDPTFSEITVAVPTSVDVKPGGDAETFVFVRGGSAAIRRATARAVIRRRHLLSVSGEVVVRNDVVPALFGALMTDPMFGSARQPRFASATTDRLVPLGGLRSSLSGSSGAAPTAIGDLVPLIITSDLPSACVLFRASVLESLEPPISASYAASLAWIMGQIRGRGSRNVVCNRAVVALSDIDGLDRPTFDPYAAGIRRGAEVAAGALP